MSPTTEAPKLVSSTPPTDKAGAWPRCVECDAWLPDARRDRGLCLACEAPETTPLQLVERRAAAWLSRAERWHRVLNRERAWLARGTSAPVLFGALASLAVALLVLLPALRPLQAWSALAAPAATVLAGLVGWRAALARTQIEAGKPEQCWVTADRVSEHYKGVLVLVRAGDLSEVQALRISQEIESSARFGLPDTVREALARPAAQSVPEMCWQKESERKALEGLFPDRSQAPSMRDMGWRDDFRNEGAQRAGIHLPPREKGEVQTGDAIKTVLREWTDADRELRAAQRGQGKCSGPDMRCVVCGRRAANGSPCGGPDVKLFMSFRGLVCDGCWLRKRVGIKAGPKS